MRLFSRPLVAACFAGLFGCAGLWGQAPTAPIKVGVINFQKAVLDTAEIMKFSNELQVKYRPRQDALQKAQQELSDLQTQANASEGKLSASGAADLQARGQRQQRKVDRLTEDIQNDFDAERDEALRRASARMRDVVKKISEEKGLDMVLDSGQGYLIFSKPGLDVTEEAVAAYNKAYPAAK